jgi:DNA-binding CsgD family transcriptional regulator
LLYSAQRESSSSPAAADEDISAAMDEFRMELDGCVDFDETFAALRSYAARHGVSHITCGLCAEPPGQLTNGARAIAMSFPDYMQQLYRDMGGERVDPTVPYTVANTRGLLIDNELLIAAIGGDLPKPVISMGNALLDNDMRFVFHQPERDDLTEAPLLTAFVLDRRAVGGLRDRRSPLRRLLSAMSRSVWDRVQQGCMLRRIPSLSVRQTEALTLIARGFTVAEVAEQLAVSVRSAEKILAAARERLGARTTAAAIYRAMVYRALS